MVRFKVIKGSHLLLAFAILLLSIVIGLIALRGEETLSNSGTNEILNKQIAYETTDIEAKAQQAFASNNVSELKIEIIPDSDVRTDNQISQKSILIYHTHTHEAYEQDSTDPYEAIETWRTLDEEHSVVRLGSALASELRNLGYEVIHDTSDHELDSLDDSYVRSLQTLEGYKRSFDLCIDLHRDAYVEGLALCLKADDDIEYAQIMMLVGRGDNYNSAQKPNYTSNLRFAQNLTNALNSRIDGICRNVTVKTGRYNQHIGQNNILIEVGHNKNTLKQALASIPCLAASIHATMIQSH